MHVPEEDQTSDRNMTEVVGVYNILHTLMCIYWFWYHIHYKHYIPCKNLTAQDAYNMILQLR